MRLATHRIDRDLKNLYKKTFGPYFFKPCSCGCTNSYGIGFQFVWFGVKIIL